MSQEFDKDKVYYKNLILDEVKINSNEDKREFKAIITTNAVDRDDEVMLPEGMNKKEFEKNGIILFNHNPDLPIGTAMSLRRSGTDRWKATARLASEGVSEVADTIWKLVKDGILKGISVGFKIIERRLATEKDIEMFGKDVRTVISKWKLLEFSIVSVGANQDALILGFKDVDIDPKMYLADNYKEDIDDSLSAEKEIVEEIKKVNNEVDEKVDEKDKEIVNIEKRIKEIEKKDKIDMDLVLHYFRKEIKKEINKNGRLFN